MALDTDTILSIIKNELSTNEVLIDENPLNYYTGQPRGDEVTGRSQVISTDVADAIEWIMPQIMRAFTENHEIVTFDPVGPMDQQQAELESKFVYDVLMKQNDGFIILYEFIKDALIQNNGVIKVFYEETQSVTTRRFSGLSTESVMAALSSPNVVSYEATDNGDGTANLKLTVENVSGKVVVESVPIEQFRYNLDHNSANLDTARFTAHVFKKTVSELLEEGYSASVLEELSTSNSYNPSAYRFAAQNENTLPLDSLDESLREVDVAECYMKIDVDGDGIAEYCKILVAGYESPTHILSIEELDDSPWVATTPILMPHKFKGLSIYDRLKQLQDAKTSLFRNILDNFYLQNNQRTVVVEGQVNMDDLLISRPGGIVRAKRLDAITPLPNPSLDQNAFSLMQYLDGVRAGRTGVAPEGEVTPQRIGERVGSEGVQMMLNAKEELVGLIVRTIAETGIKPLCVKIRDLLVRHQDAVPYEYKGQWVTVSPAEWQPRSGTTVRVGTGTGNKKAQLEAIGALLQMQGQMVQVPGQSLVTPDKVYNTLNDFCKWSGLVSAANYFMDPVSPEGQQYKEQTDAQQQQVKEMQDQLQVQTVQAQTLLAQAELQKAQAEQMNVQLKAQIEDLKGRLTLATKDAEAAAKDADRLLKRYEIDTKAALELTKIEAQSKTQEDQNMLQNRQLMANEMAQGFERARKEKEMEHGQNMDHRREDRADYETAASSMNQETPGEVEDD
jgi:hypothetical protein